MTLLIQCHKEKTTCLSRCCTSGDQLKTVRSRLGENVSFDVVTGVTVRPALNQVGNINADATSRVNAPIQAFLLIACQKHSVCPQCCLIQTYLEVRTTASSGRCQMLQRRNLQLIQHWSRSQIDWRSQTLSQVCPLQIWCGVLTGIF